MRYCTIGYNKLDLQKKWCYNIKMNNDFNLAGLMKGQNIYALIRGKVRYAEISGGNIPRLNSLQTRWQILLIDEESMCEPIEDATRYIKASELFFDKQGAEKELFRRKLKGQNDYT